MKRLLSLLLAFILVFSLAACGGSSQETADTQPVESTEQPEKEEPAPEPVSETAEDVPVEVESDRDERGILGSHGTDIRMGLTKFGLEEPAINRAPDEAKEYFAFTSSTSYQDTSLGVTYDYSLTMDSAFQIIGASFGITNNSASYDNFVSLAKLYLAYSSTMPYNAADSVQAKNWVNETLGSVSSDDTASITIGDATFELYGTASGDGFGSFWLDVSKAVE